MKRFSLFSFRRCILAALVLMLALPWAVFADQVVNTIDTTIDPDLETVTITAGGSASVVFDVIPSNTIPPGDASGCNATGANPATVNLSIPAGVTASPTSLTFQGCGLIGSVSFSSSTVGSYTISVASVSGGKSGSLWDTAPAAFTLIVNPAPPSDTTPPVITPNVSGTLGTNGWYVSDVSVSWTVTDPESAITFTSGCGPTTISADTLGTTLTCTATSAGGTSSASVTIKRDATPPTITASISPASPAATGWYNISTGAPTVSFTCNDTGGSGLADPCPDPVTLGNGADQSVSGGPISDVAGNSSGVATISGINVDLIAPTIAASATANGSPYTAGTWINKNVTVTFSCSDNGGSSIASCGPTPQVVSMEGVTPSVSGTATDNAGNSTSTSFGPVNIDKTPPTITITLPANGANYTLNQALASNYSCIDGLSDVASCVGPVPSGSNIDTGSVGTKPFTVDATDNAGNSASLTHYYGVIYNWNGFFRPVDNLPTLNVAKAGSAIPVKFSLSGYQGLSIFAAGYPRSVPIACDSTSPVDGIEETVTAGGSSLNYDATADQYIYVWKTDKAWAGTCRQLIVMLNDGSEPYLANFKFTK